MAYEITVVNEAITIRQNADFSKTYKFADEDGVALELDNCKFKSQIKSHNDISAEVLFTFDSEANDGSVVVDLLTGEVTFAIPKATAVTFTFKEAYYDALVTWADGITQPFREGVAILKKGITTP